MKKNTTDKFLIGSWVSFYPFDIHGYEYQLDQMKDAGLNFNIFPAEFGCGMLNAERWADVERQYQARNMYYCMNGGLNEDMLREGVEYAKGKERCIGYHLIDEPGGAALPNVGHFCRAYREADSKRYPFVNLFPSYVGNAVMEGDHYQYCTRFVREAGEENIDYLSHDYYPFHLNGTALDIFGDMEVIRRVAFENGRLRTHGFPQSTAWMGTRMPNIDEMRWNVYGYLAYGFKALSWFNLVCPGKSDTEGECFRESVIYRDGTIRDPQLLKDFGDLNREVHTLGDTLMKLDAVHAYHTKDGIGGVELLPADWMIAPVGDADFIISHMVSKKGDETYFMLFNKSFERSVTASFALSKNSGIQGLEYVSPFDGSRTAVVIDDGVLTETFRPGEGKLYRVIGNPTVVILPIGRNPARLNVELADPVEITGLDVTFSADTVVKAADFKATTNKRFPEEKTLNISFTEKDIQDGGNGLRIRFDGYMTKYIRFTVNDEASWNNYGYAELRVRFADESDILPETVEEEVETIYYDDVDFTALDESIAIFEELKEAEYTAESWHAAKNFYDAAVSMKDGTYPQNAVTVAAWKLTDSIRDLEPILWVTPKKAVADEVPSAENTENGRSRVHLGKGIVTAAAVTLAGAVAGATIGILKGLRKKKK